MLYTLQKCLLVLSVAFAGLRAAPDVLDEQSRLQVKLDAALLDLHGERWMPADWPALNAQSAAFGDILQDAEAVRLWKSAATSPVDALEAAQALGHIRAVGQHVAALEMLGALQRGEIERAREWRAVIQLPKYASAVDGALALQRLGADTSHRAEVEKLLSREFVIWQLTRAREKADNLDRLVTSGRATPSLVAARASEIDALSLLPAEIMHKAVDQASFETAERGEKEAAFAALMKALRAEDAAWLGQVAPWRLALEATLPNLLGQEDVERRERIILKLLRLIPMEYRSGVRDGQITIPLEYREAKSFTIQAQQIVSELMPVWRRTQADALKTRAVVLLATMETLEKTIEAKGAVERVDNICKEIAGILQGDFGLVAKRAGRACDAVAEAVLEIRSLLGQSLVAAQAGQWRKAEALRLDAYINFDLEIEARTLPRDPTLAMRAERSFLDGERNQSGIKAALDARAKGPELSAAYERALAGMEECAALLKVGLSPGAATTSTIVIVLREGLEAVIILAAILAGLRGPINAPIRRRVASGAWLALLASGLLFVVSQHLLAGLSRYGETLEAIISTLAVIVLAIVTNWVFHKVYWVGWNAKLREMSKAAQTPTNPRIESLALVGVGFMTIFREGFETTLFLQSLILEAKLRPVLIGLAIASVLIAALGYAVFWVGARLPYRKMMIYTGVLVVAVMFTFVGSTTRIFQTVGWLPIHPVPGLELPTWMGVWLGLYPSWEGLLMPLLTFVYVGGMWFYAKAAARRGAQTPQPAPAGTLSSKPETSPPRPSEPAAVRPTVSSHQ